MVNLKSLRKQAIEELMSANNDSPAADVDSILSSMGFSKSDIIIGEKKLDSSQHKTFHNSIQRLLTGEPVQYIVGGCEFMSLWFEVNPSTLIPRCDTEILVEHIIEKFSHTPIRILDIGSGSGCIAISLAYYLPNAEVLSVDISEKAIETARRNAEANGVSDRCKFEYCDILNSLPDFLPDVIVSNPPYIPQKDIDGLDSKVKNHEPLTALVGGTDGLDFYRRIANDVPLAKGGTLAFEVGINQASDVKNIMSKHFNKIVIGKDLSGIERTLMGTLICD